MGGLANQLDTTGARMETIRVLFFATFAAPLLSQTKFADSKNNNKNVDEKIFTGDPTIDTLGGGRIGVGLGALGASILGPTIGQVLGGNNGFAAQGTQGCGKRRKRQADGQTRFFLPSGGSCTCGRKKRQAASPNKGKDEPNTKFFGSLFGGNDQNCGACCYSQGYNQGASNYDNQGFNHGSSNQSGRCQCDYSKTFTDQNFFKFPEPTSLVVPGATQLDGVTLAVEISSLPEGIWLFLLSTLTFRYIVSPPTNNAKLELHHC